MLARLVAQNPLCCTVGKRVTIGVYSLAAKLQYERKSSRVLIPQWIKYNKIIWIHSYRYLVVHTGIKLQPCPKAIHVIVRNATFVKLWAPRSVCHVWRDVSLINGTLRCMVQAKAPGLIRGAGAGRLSGPSTEPAGANREHSHYTAAGVSGLNSSADWKPVDCNSYRITKGGGKNETRLNAICSKYNKIKGFSKELNDICGWVENEVMVNADGHMPR